MDSICRSAFIVLLTFGSSAALAEEAPTDDTTEALEATEALDVDSILANPLGEEDYRETRNCLWGRQIDTIEILDENLVVFKGRLGTKTWLNRLATTCPGLRPDMVPVTGQRSGSICRMDMIGARSRSSSPFEDPVRCWLGKFEAIGEEQLEALKRAIAEGEKGDRKATEST